MTLIKFSVDCSLRLDCSVPDNYKLMCLLMWNHCSPVFHFHWLYSALRLLSNNLLLHYRYHLRTSWTYWTSGHLKLTITFSTMENTTSSCTEQPWDRRSLLLSQKLWCKTSRNAPLQLNCPQTILLWLCYVDDTFTAVHKDETDDFYKHLNEQHADTTV